MGYLRKIISSPKANAILVALFAFIIYLKTLAPSVTFIDSGELAAVAGTLGIAHPTGYPLFTLLGWIFSRLPIATEQIVRLNIMAALFCSIGIYFFYHLVHFVLTGVFGRSSTIKFSKKETFAIAVRISSAGAALLLAFSETYWSQAVSVEVYSLHVLFLSLVTLCFFKAVFQEQWNRGEGTKSPDTWWYTFALTLGFSFTNHMTTVLLAPGFLFLYFATQGFGEGSWKRIARMIIPFLVGLSVYLYLPLRSSMSPAMNWGNPSTLEKFIWHWTGKQYRVWIFSSTEAAGRQFKYFLSSLPYEFAYVGLFLALAGIVILLRGHKKIAATFLILFVSCVLYSINYDIHDIDSYFLLAYLCIAMFSGAAFLFLFRWLQDTLNTPIIVSLILLVSLVPCIVHYQQTNESQNYLVEDYTMNMFSSLQPNALALSYQWDYWVSASFYYQLVKHYRVDVAVIDKELLRRSWYLKHLEQAYPWLIANSRFEVDAFTKELYKFEHELPYDSRIIEATYVGMIRSFITKNLSERPVYVTPEIEAEFTSGMQRIPEGLALHLYADSMNHDMRNVGLKFRNFERSGRLEYALKDLYATAYISKGIVLLQNQSLTDAKLSFEEALKYNPASIDARNFLRRLPN